MQSELCIPGCGETNACSIGDGGRGDVCAHGAVGHLEEGDVEPGNGMGPEGSIAADEIDLFIQRHLREEIVNTLLNRLGIVTDELCRDEHARRKESDRNEEAAGDGVRMAHRNRKDSGVCEWV